MGGGDDTPGRGYSLSSNLEVCVDWGWDAGRVSGLSEKLQLGSCSWSIGLKLMLQITETLLKGKFLLILSEEYMLQVQLDPGFSLSSSISLFCSPCPGFILRQMSNPVFVSLLFQPWLRKNRPLLVIPTKVP